MKKTLMSLAAAAVIGTAGMTVAPQPANAAAWWVAPAIIGGVLLGGLTIAAAANSAGPYGYYAPNYYYGPGSVYVRPTFAASNCTIARERVRGGWRRVQICY